MPLLAVVYSVFINFDNDYDWFMGGNDDERKAEIVLYTLLDAPKIFGKWNFNLC